MLKFDGNIGSLFVENVENQCTQTYHWLGGYIHGVLSWTLKNNGVLHWSLCHCGRSPQCHPTHVWDYYDVTTTRPQSRENLEFKVMKYPESKVFQYHVTSRINSWKDQELQGLTVKLQFNPITFPDKIHDSFMVLTDEWDPRSSWFRFRTQRNMCPKRV